jgi:hypothetical protein
MSMTLIASAAALLVFSISGVTYAQQGTDDCAFPDVLVGGGPFSFDTAGATTSPQQSGVCPTANRDVWFRWTAPSTDTYYVDLCGGAAFDTVAAAYNGNTCPAGFWVGCNDDACGAQSQFNFPAVAGNSYMIQIGAFGTNTTGSGTFTIHVGLPPQCAISTGPDVIVGDMPDVENYGVTGSLDAISLGTTSCNLGTVNLNWFANTNQHPVIGGNLYRFKIVNGAGRFEQIGQSWLKHGFFALSQQTLCCPQCNATDGTTLGVGCSDAYGAGLNGSQVNLGPRWQVNAASGVFTYPPANPGWSGTTARRCEFLSTDVEPTAASTTRFFCETQYVTPDDAAAGNQNNNASRREMSCTGGQGADANLNFITPTVRQESAIEAWPLCETGVTLTNVQADGLFMIGSKATPLGSGNWHYEYALYNMNSDRSGGAFAVPVPAGVNITNIGFHDISYRNGDGPGNVNFSGTDWIGTVAGGAIIWSTETQAQNASANAVRWGSTYNFRFDANTAPVNGNAAIGLWKTGGPATVTGAAQVPGSGNTGFPFCFGDGSGVPCPCGNNSAPGANVGCLHSFGFGARLVASGNPSISNDTWVLGGSGMPNSSALYFQGTALSGDGAGTLFGDGLRCAGGTTIRLGTKTNAGGASQYPQAGDQSISVRGGNTVGATRTYQVWYRNAAVFCTVAGFNLTNGVAVVWLP